MTHSLNSNGKTILWFKLRTWRWRSECHWVSSSHNELFVGLWFYQSYTNLCCIVKWCHFKSNADRLTCDNSFPLFPFSRLEKLSGRLFSIIQTNDTTTQSSTWLQHWISISLIQHGINSHKQSCCFRLTSTVQLLLFSWHQCFNFNHQKYEKRFALMPPTVSL